MKYAVGYKLLSPEGDSMFDIVRDYKDYVKEVYFPWVGISSGRAAFGVRRGAADWDAQSVLETDLKEFREMGIGLDLLFNSNCYGRRAVCDGMRGLHGRRRHRPAGSQREAHGIAGCDGYAGGQRNKDTQGCDERGAQGVGCRS